MKAGYPECCFERQRPVNFFFVRRRAICVGDCSELVLALGHGKGTFPIALVKPGESVHPTDAPISSY